MRKITSITPGEIIIEVYHFIFGKESGQDVQYIRISGLNSYEFSTHGLWPLVIYRA